MWPQIGRCPLSKRSLFDPLLEMPFVELAQLTDGVWRVLRLVHFCNAFLV
jgi:hypothetical protein